jgi:hypothetical protein
VAPSCDGAGAPDERDPAALVVPVRRLVGALDPGWRPMTSNRSPRSCAGRPRARGSSPCCSASPAASHRRSGRSACTASSPTACASGGANSPCASPSARGRGTYAGSWRGGGSASRPRASPSGSSACWPARAYWWGSVRGRSPGRRHPQRRLCRPLCRRTRGELAAVAPRGHAAYGTLLRED